MVQKNELGSRIKEERVRLKLSQPAFAALAEASKGSQISWEKGTAFPNAKVLQVWGEHGADVQYIVLGIRSTTANSELVFEAYDWVFKFADKLNAREQLTADIAKELAKEIYAFLQEEELSANNILDFVSKFEQKLKVA